MTVDTSSLERPDFSSTTDLYGIVGNVYDMRLMLFDYQGLAALAISGLLPFVPVWLSAIPMSTIVDHLVDALFRPLIAR
ncbi:hypothetical protein EC912_105137 [Luteibacter rhizovicinus]|uniref:Uncharacterized protein n=1 Tax=Luteibacter rhizovicinus TaxID=242606 RepID=A0A4R3YL50_9GAMM|nr:hypothetical protein [Luteibacter rhizovicinus]TCV93277.1 hypothetical protein EC912_105137 [Luteibacter rhizovicinus]